MFQFSKTHRPTKHLSVLRQESTVLGVHPAMSTVHLTLLGLAPLLLEVRANPTPRLSPFSLVNLTESGITWKAILDLWAHLRGIVWVGLVSEHAWRGIILIAFIEVRSPAHCGWQRCLAGLTDCISEGRELDSPTASPRLQMWM